MSDVRFQTTHGWRTFTGDDLRKKLNLRSTYFRIGALTLNEPPRRALLDSSKVRVTGAIRALGHVQLERETRDGAWRTAAYIHPHNGKFVVTLRVNGPLKLRLVAEGVATAPIAYRVLKRS